MDAIGAIVRSVATTALSGNCNCSLILHWAHEPKHILHQGLARAHLLTRSVHQRLYCQRVRTLGLGLNPGQTLPLVARLQLFAVLLLGPRLLLAPCTMRLAAPLWLHFYTWL